MAEQKITELQVAEDIKPGAYVLVTQQETEGDDTIEAIRRVPVSSFAEKIGGGVDWEELQDKVDVIENQLAELTHEHIKITKFNLIPGTVEMGDSRNVFIEVKVDKTPISTELLKGTEIVPFDLSGTYGETVVPVTSDTTFKLTITDDMGHEITQSKSVNFYNGVYTGVGEENADIGSLETKTLQGSRAMTFTVTAGEGEYIYYACPTRYGTPSFYVGGFEGGFELIYSGDFTNPSGYTESYQLWRSANANLGTVKVEVK